MISIVADGIRFFRVNNNRTIHTSWFLEARMTVVPVGAALVEVKLILKSIAGLYAAKAKTRDAVHFCWQNNAVPVYRAILGEVILHTNGYPITFAPTQCGSRHRTIDSSCHAVFTCEIDRLISNIQINLISFKCRGPKAISCRSHR